MSGMRSVNTEGVRQSQPGVASTLGMKFHIAFLTRKGLARVE
jgi:hypothetical protein